jgi:hypothetical protein
MTGVIACDEGVLRKGFAPGADKAGLDAGFIGLALGLSWPCSSLALETAVGLGLALRWVFLVGKGYLSLGGRRPGEGLAACCLLPSESS